MHVKILRVSAVCSGPLRFRPRAAFLAWRNQRLGNSQRTRRTPIVFQDVLQNGDRRQSNQSSKRLSGKEARRAGGP
jgi:hypothetical protein